MKFVALVSGGKDSIYSMMECLKQGHQLLACVHLGRPSDDETEESYMYQTAGSEVVTTLVEQCIGVPLILYRRVGTSLNTSLVYEDTCGRDEVEDLHAALLLAQTRFPEVQAVSSGAILSTYQRVRIEQICTRLGLVSLGYLWRKATQQDLLQNMIDDGITAVLVRTASPPGLMPRKHLNRTLNELQHHFLALYDKYQFHVCGEGGEYETIVLDAPCFRARLILDETEIVESDDGCGVLKIKTSHAEPKVGITDPLWTTQCEIIAHPQHSPVVEEESTPLVTIHQPMAYVKQTKGGLVHVSEIMSPISAKADSETDAAVQEALYVFMILKRTLKHYGCSAKDVMMVHLYLSEISHFSAINQHYRDVFGTVLPPSRSCVAIGSNVLPGGRRVLMDCVAQCGSGEYMRTMHQSNIEIVNPYAKVAHGSPVARLRHVLHVQSISHWAPVCVGPYAQVNTYRSSIHFCAGQIGLIPTTMKLCDTWQEQLDQAWKNVASVLDSLNATSLEHMLYGLVYVVDRNSLIDMASLKQICVDQIARNADVASGAVDGIFTKSNDLDGYEDEGTRLELSKPVEREIQSCPLLFIFVSELPVEALVEIEVVAASREAANCLNIANSLVSLQCPQQNHRSMTVPWGTGHDFPIERTGLNEGAVTIYTSLRSLGYRCATCATTIACVEKCKPDPEFDNLFVLVQMIEALIQSMKDADCGLSRLDIVHLRLYVANASDDGVLIRSLFHVALGRSLHSEVSYSVIPVRSISQVGMSCKQDYDNHILYALQAIAMDPVHLDTELWLHHGRLD